MPERENSVATFWLFIREYQMLRAWLPGHVGKDAWLKVLG